MIVYTHNDCFKKFNGQGHPERKERLDSIINSLKSSPELKIDFKEAPLADMNSITLVHPKEHIEKIYQDALKLEHENEKLIQEKLQLKAELQLAENNTQIQKDTSSRNWFIVGAIVLFFGMMIGFIAPGILNRKRF